MEKIILIAITLVFYGTCHAQVETTKYFAPEISGQIMIAANGDELVLNLGGSGITFKYTQTVMSINFLPSLNYNLAEKKLIPALGIGPQWQFKSHLLIGIPIYYTHNQWHATVGFGYRFHPSHAKGERCTCH